MTMLPRPTSEKFPEALKAARQAKGLSYTKLAMLCGISPVMPSRYENRTHGNFGPPSEKTWEKLNEALFGVVSTPAVDRRERTSLEDASTDELIQALKARGATSVTVTY